MERETRIDLSQKLNSLISSSAKGVQGLDPLIESTIQEIMDRDGIKPETRENMTNGWEKARHLRDKRREKHG